MNRFVPNTKKNILILTSTFPRWNNDTEPPFVFELTKRLARCFNCLVLSPHHKGAEISEIMGVIHVKRFKYFFSQLQTLAYEGGILSRLKQNRARYLLIPFFLTAEFISVIRILQSGRISLIHAHWLIPQGLIAVLAKKLVRKPVKILCTIHGGDFYSLQGKLLDRLKHYVLANTDSITVVSHAMKSDLVDFGIEEERIKVIPMGVDLEISFKRIPDIPRSPHSILFVGRLVEKKGVMYLIQAMEVVAKKYKTVKLTIAGSGPYRKQLEKQVSSLGLDNNITFIGNIVNHDLPILYNQHQIVVFPSIIAENGDREGFGLVLVEALGCECAVISTNLAAMRDIISHEKEALIIEQKNAASIANAIDTLLSSPELALELASRGRKKVVQYFDWETTGSNYIELITETISKPEPHQTNPDTL